MGRLSLNSDWFLNGTKDQLQEQLKSFIFEGPGFYLTEHDTLLVVPNGYDIENPWKKEWPDPTVFTAYIFNCEFKDTLFSHLNIAPCRVDKREKWIG